MPTPASRPHRLISVAIVAFLVVGGCSAAAAPATQGPLASIYIAPTPVPPTRRPTPSPTATPSPTPVASPSAAPEPETDLASGLLIGAPYELVANPANKALTASFSMDFAGTHLEAVMNGREIRRKGSLVGAAFVMEIRGIKMTREVFEAAANATGRATFSTILGQRVAYVTTQTKVGMYALHGNIVMVGGVDDAATETLLKSVIEANLDVA